MIYFWLGVTWRGRDAKKAG